MHSAFYACVTPLTSRGFRGANPPTFRPEDGEVALDEATLQLLRVMSSDPNAVPLTELEPQQARAVSANRAQLFAPGPELHESRDFRLPVAGGDSIRMRIHNPKTQAHSVVLYLHGGGWVLGSIDAYDAMARHLAADSGASVVLAEYRKAPEHPFPIPVDDCWEAWQWVLGNMAELAAPGAKLYLAGDSAGGNLAAVTARKARDSGGPAPDGQILIYPVTDHDFGRGSYLEAENQTLLPVAAMEYFWGHYVPDPGERSHPDASPIRCEDLSGLAPALVITAEHDVLRDEGERYASELSRAGVPVQQVRWPGQMHGFIQMTGVLPASLEATGYIANYISNLSTIESE